MTFFICNLLPCDIVVDQPNATHLQSRNEVVYNDLPMEGEEFRMKCYSPAGTEVGQGKNILQRSVMCLS